METTIQSLETEIITEWVTVCNLEQILPNTGVCALVADQQVAIFRVGTGTELYAISNYDPFGKAHVLSRGLIGDRQGKLKIASPIYKQNFCLKTGQCLDDPAVKVPTYLIRVNGTEVQVCVTT
jgi:nitrite reductase (NADH) small subunit